MAQGDVYKRQTMLDAGRMAPYVGFTEEEVHGLCEPVSYTHLNIPIGRWTTWWCTEYILLR